MPGAPSRRVLVVDDEPDIRESLRDIIEASIEDTLVITARDGQEAIDLLRTNGPFDLVLTDERMPRATGGEVLAWAKEHRVPAARVLLSALPEAALAPAAKVADAVLKKPVEVRRLVKTLRMHLPPA